MSQSIGKGTSRREFLKGTGRLAAISAVTAGIAPRMYAGENNTIQLALIGCGGRGSGAAADALSVKHGPMKLVAMADAFENRLADSYKNLKEAHGDKVDVPAGAPVCRLRRLPQGDGLPQAGRHRDLRHAAGLPLGPLPATRSSKNLNVFMEKPITVDGPTSKRMLKLAEEASAKNLKVGVGLMSRHSRALQELAKRIQDGEIGDIILERGYRMHGPIGFFSSLPKPAGVSEVIYQIQRFHSFLWASGGNYSDFYIHIIDHLGWMKGEWPVKAQALGGRHYRQSPEGVTYVDQNLDTYAVEYTYADGAKFNFDGRCINGCTDIYSSYIHGSKGIAVASKSGDCGAPSSIHKGQNPTRATAVWESKVRPERGESVPERVERSRRRHPGRQAVQRGQTRRRGQPRDEHGPHVRPHGPGNHLRRDAQLRARDGAWPGQADVRRRPHRSWRTPTAGTPSRSRAS